MPRANPWSGSARRRSPVSAAPPPRPESAGAPPPRRRFHASPVRGATTVRRSRWPNAATVLYRHPHPSVTLEAAPCRRVALVPLPRGRRRRGHGGKIRHGPGRGPWGGGLPLPPLHGGATARRRRRACIGAAAAGPGSRRPDARAPARGISARPPRARVRGCRSRRRAAAAGCPPEGGGQPRGDTPAPRVHEKAACRGRCVLTERRAGRASVSNAGGELRACQTSMEPAGGDCHCMRAGKGPPPVSGGGGRLDA